MNRQAWMWLLLAVMILAGCSKNGNTDQLLGMIPQSSPAVGVIDVEEALAPDFLQGVEMADDVKARIEKLQTGKGGIYPKVAIFLKGEQPVIVGAISDEKEFAQLMETEGVKEGKYNKYNEYLTDGEFFWGGAVTAADIEGWKSLKTADSWAKSKLADYLMGDDAVRAVVDIRAFASSLGTMGNGMLAMAFDDPSYLALQLDVEPQRHVEVEAKLLTSEGRDTKCNLKLDKLSKRFITESGGSGAAVMALALQPAMLDQYLPMLNSAGVPSFIIKAFGCLNGQVAVFMQNAYMPTTIQLGLRPGTDSSVVEGLLKERGMDVTVSGETLRATVPNAQAEAGAISSKEAAEMLEGSAFGFAFRIPAGNDVDAGCVVLKTDDGSLELKADLQISGSALRDMNKSLKF